jgi:hypothetical protein
VDAPRELVRPIVSGHLIDESVPVRVVGAESDLGLQPTISLPGTSVRAARMRTPRSVSAARSASVPPLIPWTWNDAVGAAMA